MKEEIYNIKDVQIILYPWCRQNNHTYRVHWREKYKFALFQSFNCYKITFTFQSFNYYKITFTFQSFNYYEITFTFQCFNNNKFYKTVLKL